MAHFEAVAWNVFGSAGRHPDVNLVWRCGAEFGDGNLADGEFRYVAYVTTCAAFVSLLSWEFHHGVDASALVAFVFVFFTISCRAITSQVFRRSQSRHINFSFLVGGYGVGLRTSCVRVCRMQVRTHTRVEAVGQAGHARGEARAPSFPCLRYFMPDLFFGLRYMPAHATCASRFPALPLHAQGCAYTRVRG